MGAVGEAVRAAFPAHYRWIIGAGVAAAAVAAVAAAVDRLRRSTHEVATHADSIPLRMRYALIAAAVIASGVYARAVRTGNPDVDVVEAFHFVEYGIVAYLFYRAWRSRPDRSGVVLAACAALAVGIADEWVQWFVPGRVGELHDVWLNVAAIACGLLFSVAIHPPQSLAATRDRRSRLVLTVSRASLLLAVAAFVDRVHLGYEVTDRVRTFRSQYDARGLEAAATDRMTRWAKTAPPTDGFAREDHYLSEGLWHVQRRTLAVTAGNWRAAWHENAILERFFVPVLNRGSAWSAEQKAAVEQRTGVTARGAYVSDAAPYPILLVQRPLFWTMTLLVGAAVVWFGRGSSV
jgi:VanZ family protein